MSRFRLSADEPAAPYVRSRRDDDEYQPPREPRTPDDVRLCDQAPIGGDERPVLANVGHSHLKRR